MRCLRWTSMLRRQPASMDHQDLDKGRLPAIDNGATKLSFQARLTLSKFTIGNYFQVEIKAMSIGATPPANGDAMTWASEVKQSPLPFEKHLTSITNLFNSQYLNGEDFWKDANLHQIDELKTLFTMVLNEYCATLLSKGKTSYRIPNQKEFFGWSIHVCRWGSWRNLPWSIYFWDQWGRRNFRLFQQKSHRTQVQPQQIAVFLGLHIPCWLRCHVLESRTWRHGAYKRRNLLPLQTGKHD